MRRLVLFVLVVHLFNFAVAQEAGTFEDPRDGQSYKIVKINDQIWMSENLNYKTSGSLCYKGANSCEEHGRLYSWRSAEKACPPGWHLPSDEEWKILEKNTGMKDHQLNATRFRISPAVHGAITQNGTTGLNLTKSGWMEPGGRFYHLNRRGVYWTSSNHRSYEGWFRLFDNRRAIYRRYENKKFYYSVRCVNDRADIKLVSNTTVQTEIKKEEEVKEELVIAENKNDENTTIKEETTVKTEETVVEKDTLYADKTTDELNKMLEELIKDEKPEEAEELRKLIHKKETWEKIDAEYAKKTHQELNTMLDELVANDDYEEAIVVKEEIVKREKENPLLKISTEELKKREEEAILDGNYDEAKKLRKEIDRRKIED